MSNSQNAAAMPRRRPIPVSKALGMTILQLAGRNAADPGHNVARYIDIEVLIEHPDNLATPSHARDQIHARAPAAVQPMVTRCPALPSLLAVARVGGTDGYRFELRHVHRQIEAVPVSRCWSFTDR